MAESSRGETIPFIPAKNWWDLRRRFKQTLPGRVNPGYVATVLQVEEDWARTLIRNLTALGLIDESGEPTQLANDWRHDDSYPDVCKAVRERIYTQDLRDALPCPDPDRSRLEAWFMRTLKIGAGAAKRHAAFYQLLCQADASAVDKPSAGSSDGRAPATRRSRSTQPRAMKPAAQPAKQDQATLATEDGSQGQPQDPKPPARQSPLTPEIHVNIQIHIAADASAVQIDAIFASMARHLRSAELS